MMESILGDGAGRFIIAAGAVAIGLLCLAAVLRIMRNRPSSPFVRGGKNRQPRLAVLDAAAVDTRRRLVLVRRDDVEHLIMIGGPTDIVIESRIASEAATPISTNLQAAPEQRVPEAPIAATRSEAKPKPMPGPAPAEATVSPVRQPEPPSEPPQVAGRAEPPMVATIDQRATTLESQRPEPVSRPATPAPSIPPVSANNEPPHQVFGAARDRVLPIEPPARDARPAPPPLSAEPVKATPAQPLPVRPATPDAAAEFERMLDAEISGDLQRLAPTAPSRPESRPAPTGRQEPVLGATPENIRKEPTIEEEMERMLADISATRKL